MAAREYTRKVLIAVSTLTRKILPVFMPPIRKVYD
jgi:hypothetical protein